MYIPYPLAQKTLGACPQKNDMQSVQETLSYKMNHPKYFVPTEDTLLPSSHRSPKPGQPLADMGRLGDKKTFPADCNVCFDPCCQEYRRIHLVEQLATRLQHWHVNVSSPTGNSISFCHSSCLSKNLRDQIISRSRDEGGSLENCSESSTRAVE